jgi:hypothetical protein
MSACKYCVKQPIITAKTQNAFDEVEQVKIENRKTSLAVKSAHDSAIKQPYRSAQSHLGDAVHKLERLCLAEETWRRHNLLSRSTNSQLNVSVVVGAAHVVTALVTHQFAFQLAQPRAADRAVEHRLSLAWRLVGVL